TFAWITLAFSALEFFGARLRLKDTWDPRKLPPLVKHSPRKSRFELITQLLLQTIFGVWWLVGLHYQYLILGPCLPPLWRGVASHLSPVCGDGAGGCFDHCRHADMAAVDPG